MYQHFLPDRRYAAGSRVDRKSAAASRRFHAHLRRPV